MSRNEIISGVILSVMFAIFIAWGIVGWIDHTGDQLCEKGVWKGEKLCPKK